MDNTENSMEGIVIRRAVGVLCLGMLMGIALSAIAETCNELTAGLQKESAKCLNKKTYEDRLTCVKTAGDALPFSDSDWKDCQTATKSLAAEMAQEEGKQYPEQKLAFVDGTNFTGNIPGITIGGTPTAEVQAEVNSVLMNDRGPASSCEGLISDLTKQSSECLNIPLDSAREACGTKAVDFAHTHGYSSCQRQVDGLREQFIQKEKKKYSNSVM
jgi:hypothetical protein